MHNNEPFAGIDGEELAEIVQKHRASKVRGEAVALFNVFGRTLYVEFAAANWLLPEIEGLESDPALVYPIYAELCRAADIQERQWVRNEERLRCLYAPASKRARVRGSSENSEQIAGCLNNAEARLDRGGLDWSEIYRGVLARWLVENPDTGLGALSTADNLRDTWLADKGHMERVALTRRPPEAAEGENRAALEKAWREGGEVEGEQRATLARRKLV